MREGLLSEGNLCLRFKGWGGGGGGGAYFCRGLLSDIYGTIQERLSLKQLVLTFSWYFAIFSQLFQ